MTGRNAWIVYAQKSVADPTARFSVTVSISELYSSRCYSNPRSAKDTT
jgi:hypothetical protein